MRLSSTLFSFLIKFFYKAAVLLKIIAQTDDLTIQQILGQSINIRAGSATISRRGRPVISY